MDPRNEKGLAMKEERKVIRVSVASDDAIRQYAVAKDIEIGAAADALIRCATGRLEALRKDYEKRKAMPRAAAIDTSDGVDR